MEYKASIYEAESGKFLTHENKGEFVLGDEKDRIIFYEEADAESTLQMLNDETDLCFVLLDENK